MKKRLSRALHSSKAAIDLVSIMVGVIVIGLIAGVIAATVFAVIPWAQDNAAKQQLANIAPAQSAYAGMHADPVSGGDGSYGNLTDDESSIVADRLMTANQTKYCSTAADDGKSYTSYARSDSGRVFTSSNNAPPTVFQGDASTTCLLSVNDTGNENSTGGISGGGIPLDQGVTGFFELQSNVEDRTFERPGAQLNSIYSCDNFAGAFSCPEPEVTPRALDSLPATVRVSEPNWHAHFDSKRVVQLMGAAWKWCEKNATQKWADAVVSFDDQSRSIISCTDLTGSSIVARQTGVLDGYFTGMFSDTRFNGAAWFADLESDYYAMRTVQLNVHNIPLPD